jgi:hypothetical protein
MAITDRNTPFQIETTVANILNFRTHMANPAK